MAKLLPYLEPGRIEAGCDEAGRGCLSGPVVAAAVVLDAETARALALDDSKKLSEKKRDKLRELIEEKALAWAVSFVSNEKIDEINILQASLLAMKRSVENLNVKPKKILVDGAYTFPCSIDIQSIVGGDNLVPSISAASIIAKVHRDNLMREYSKEFPNYGFHKHNGYPTKFHKEMIKRHGITRIHRQTFKGVNQ